MTSDQIKELRQALEGGDLAFESAFTPEVCAALFDHISQLEQDAARYQWLKHQAAMASHLPECYAVCIEIDGEYRDHDLEETIDDLIAKSSQQDKGKEIKP